MSVVNFVLRDVRTAERTRPTATVRRPSVRPSVTLMYYGHIGPSPRRTSGNFGLVGCSQPEPATLKRDKIGPKLLPILTTNRK